MSEEPFNFEKFLLESPLYRKFNIINTNPLEIGKLVSFKGPFDFYCPECKQKRTFNKSNLVKKFGSAPAAFENVRIVQEIYDPKYIEEVMSEPQMGLRILLGDSKPPYHFKNELYCPYPDFVDRKKCVIFENQEVK